MKLWYLYVRDYGIPTAHAMTDGHFELIDYMKRNGIVDEVDAVLDIYRVRKEERVITNAGVVVRRLNGLECLRPNPGDVVWVRGGWKAWLPWIGKCMDRKIWLMFYDANTGRKSWSFWDVVVSDIIRHQTIDKNGRLWYWYPKPVSHVFQPRNMELQFDVCIGASRVFDKKGQWRVYNAILEYERLFGEKLKCAMPGCYRYGGVHTREMQRSIKGHPNIVELPLIPRPQLADLFNLSKVVTHSCGGGYGDRAPLEAGACGCPIVLAATLRHALFVFKDPEIVWVPNDVDNPKEFAKGLKAWIESATPDKRKKVAEHFKKYGSIETGSGPRMRRLFEFFRAHPLANRDALQDVVLEDIPQ